jgi:hypothetical protein
MTLIIPIFIITGILAWVFRPKTGTIKARWAAILATTIPLVIIAITALIFQMLQNATGDKAIADISNTCFIVGLCLIGAAILALLGFAVARKVEITKGIGFGLNIMVILSILELVSLQGLAGV